ncbi:MAG: hypothetical protein D6754_09860 [Alphaproteobacteria bacterium]|nr:MAG: hypothetical protein D6754_09860 [Alphaproteobacteria bacterium]
MAELRRISKRDLHSAKLSVSGLDSDLKRRITLARMLSWAAREAREMDCGSSADHLELALSDLLDGHQNLVSMKLI